LAKRSQKIALLFHRDVRKRKMAEQAAWEVGVVGMAGAVGVAGVAGAEGTRLDPLGAERAEEGAESARLHLPGAKGGREEVV
jgi:hypothetical protein